MTSADFDGAVTHPTVARRRPRFRFIPRRLRRRGGRILRRVTRRWRRSIQVRVVSSTLVVSAIVVALLGFVVLHQVKQGLLQAKLRSSIAEENLGVSNARAQLTTESGDRDVQAVLQQVVQTLSPVQRGRDGGYEVVGVELVTTTGSRTSPALNNGLAATSVPTELIDAVNAGAKQYYYTYSRMLYNDNFNAPELVIGSALPLPDNSTYQFYYLFSLEQQKQTLDLVWRTLLFSGIALVMLLAGIAWLVTRQVVTPVRMAARIAERLADGRLQERMKPKGEDDLARLAASFNKMADSLQKQIRRLEELSRIQRRFVSDVSHELRTPLTTVRMAADVLHEARADFDPASARSAELLQTQLDRFESLLGDLLEHAVGAGGQAPGGLAYTGSRASSPDHSGTGHPPAVSWCLTSCRLRPKLAHNASKVATTAAGDCLPLASPSKTTAGAMLHAPRQRAVTREIWSSGVVSFGPIPNLARIAARMPLAPLM